MVDVSNLTDGCHTQAVRFPYRLNPAQKLYDVHSSFRLDMSGGGPAEIFMKQMVNRAGGSSDLRVAEISLRGTPVERAEE